MIQTISDYTVRYAKIVFSGDNVDCAHCPLLETYSRKMCRLTGIYIQDDRVADYFCPLSPEPNTFVDPATGEVIKERIDKHEEN